MRARVEALSPRQREILILVAQHYSSKEIGQFLNLSPATVDTHVANALEKLGLKTRREAGALMIDLGYTAGRMRPIPNDHHGGDHSTRHHREPARAKGSIIRGEARLQDDANDGIHDAGEGLPRKPGMSPVLLRFLLDGVYIIIFFSVMSGVAYGVHWIVIQYEHWNMDSTVLAVLKWVSYLLVGLDAIGVVTATVVLTYRFIRAILRAND